MTEFFTPGLTLSLAMLGVIALVFGGVRLLIASKDRKRGLLMLAAALVLIINVLLIAWPA
jgi:phosphate starvation-inducible membrane PsiE